MNTLLIYGACSCEHDISIITACLAKGYFGGDIFSAYLSQDNVCYLVPNDFTPKQHKNCKFGTQICFLTGRSQIALVRKNKIRRILDIDVVVNCCHGRCGEDGAIAGLCELCNLPLVGSGVVSAAISMDKIATKHTLTALGLPCVKGMGLFGGYSDSDVAKMEKWGYPIIVKPSTLGSSIGISLCHNREELVEGLHLAFSYDSRVLCEKALTDFYEINCAAMRVDGKVETSSVERPYTLHDILTFQDKYLQNGKFISNQEIEGEMQEKIKKLTKKIYQQMGLCGVVRVDFLVDNDGGKVYVNEVNSIPGSLAYGLFGRKYSPSRFGTLLVGQAFADYENAKKLTHTFESGILDNPKMKK